MLCRPTWRQVVLLFTGMATMACDPVPGVRHRAQVQVTACPNLYIKLLPAVEAVVRRYKQANGLGGQTLYYVDVDYRQGKEQQLTLYSSIDLTSVFVYHPESYSTVGADYVALCSGVASLGNPIPRAQALCDMLSQDWYGKRLTRAELKTYSGRRSYNPPIWRVILKRGAATVVDSAASFYSADGGRIQIQSIPPPPQ